MAASKLSICHVYAFQVICLIFNIAFANEHLALDKTLTRQEITTLLRHPVNLGCYVTKINSSQTLATPAPASLTYRWVKGNFSVTQSPRSRIHGNVLVVTPESDEDFGKYECNVTNGVSSTRCSILLIQGWRDNRDNSTINKKRSPGTGCVNVSVLMPVLAVAVLSCLLFVHLLVRRKEPKILQPSQRRRKSTIAMDHPHAEQRKRSRDLLYSRFHDETLNNNEKKQEAVSIEMHANSGITSTPVENPIDESKRVRRSGFSNKSFRHASLDMDDIGSQISDGSSEKSGFYVYNKTFKSDSFDVGESEDAPRASVEFTMKANKGDEANEFYNRTFKNDSIDDSDGEVFTQHSSEETVGVDKPKRGKAKGFINKTYHSESVDLDDGDKGGRAEVESVVVELKAGKGKGFFNKAFKTESVDVPDAEVEAQASEKKVVEEPTGETEKEPAMDTYF